MSCLWLIAALVTSSADAPVLSSKEVLLSDKGGRLRFGLSAAVGPFIPAPSVSLAVEARFGYQVSRRFSVFAAGGVGFQASGAVYFPHGFLGLIAEYAPVDFFYLGGGPAFAFGGFNSRVSSLPGLLEINEHPVQPRYVKPGLDLRLGFGLAPGRPPFFRRSGFNIGLALQIFFMSDMQLVWDPTHSQRVTSATIATFAPMLTLGYDSR